MLHADHVRFSYDAASELSERNNHYLLMNEICLAGLGLIYIEFNQHTDRFSEMVRDVLNIILDI